MSDGSTDHRIIAFLEKPICTTMLQISLSLAALMLMWSNLHKTLEFDDAFMFYRYALHLREGLGVTWNPGGAHTLGETSPLWGVLIWGGSFLPISAGPLLIMASSLSGIGAVFCLSLAVVLNTRSPLLLNRTNVTFLIVLSLCMSGIFLSNTVTGMETMLAFGVNALFCGIVWRWSRDASATNSWLVGLIALAAFLTRPESALPSLIAIILFAVLPGSERVRLRALLLSVCVLCAGVLLYLTLCKAYFGSAFPLAFYVKGHHFYKGYAGRKQPVQRAIQFLGSCSAFLFLIVWLARRRHWRMIAVFSAALLGTIAYLCTVTQLMGAEARYYVPYCAFIALPAMIVLDDALAEERGLFIDNPLSRICLSIGLFVVLGGFFPQTAIRKLDDLAEGPRICYPEAMRVETALTPLPAIPWERGWQDFADQILVDLPKDAIAAATEVGYVGARVPNMNVIDLSGLNDEEIGAHGFHMDEFLERKPDVVWLPYMDYTYLRGTFFSSDKFLSEYTVYDGALNYGIALRKNSPYLPAMLVGLQRVWAKEYKGYPMRNYVVRSATWNSVPVPF